MSDALATRDALADVRVRAIASNGSGVADLPVLREDPEADERDREKRAEKLCRENHQN